MSPKAKSTRKKAAAKRKHRAAGIKAAAKRKHRAAGIKAAAKRKHRAAGKKAKATLEAKRQVQPAAAPRVVTRTIGKAEITEVPATAPAPGPQEPGSQTETTGPTEPQQS